MVRRGRGRACLAEMHRYMKNLQRQVADLTNMQDSQRIIQRELYDEEIDQAEGSCHYLMGSCVE
jgi:hypothetical protein